MAEFDAAAEAQAARQECEVAVDTILEAAERVAAQARSLASREPAIAAELSAAVGAIMEACAFQDIVGQRLTRLADGPDAEILLSGPALAGGGMSQADVEALLNAPV